MSSTYAPGYLIVAAQLENALLLCVDEKTQIHALERTQPLLPMGFGYVEGRAD